MTRDSVPVCPECDKACVIHHATPSEVNRVADEPRHSCSDCGARFSEPNYREPEYDTSNNANGLARELLDADPDEVSK